MAFEPCDDPLPVPMGPLRRWTRPLLTLFLCLLLTGIVLIVFHNKMLENRARLVCDNHLHRIALATQEYMDHFGSLPPAYTVSESGQPLHSWRVLLLPWLGEEDLYRQIRLEEPWDSVHNRTFHDRMPSCYRCPAPISSGSRSVSDRLSTTPYSVVTGHETLFPPGQVVRPDQVTDGFSNTILVVERRSPICWMAPDRELSLIGILRQSDHLSELLGGGHRGGFPSATLGGSTPFINFNVDSAVLRMFLTRNDSQAGESTVSVPTGE